MTDLEVILNSEIVSYFPSYLGIKTYYRNYQRVITYGCEAYQVLSGESEWVLQLGVQQEELE